FRASALRVLDRARIREGFRLLSDFKIAPLDDQALRDRSYLTAAGAWDSGFRERYRSTLVEALVQIRPTTGAHRILTTEQSRIFREVVAQADDHMHVQGYAGTGKSYLIKALVSALGSSGGTILVLAERKRQLDALLTDVERTSYLSQKTFGQLA